MTKISQYTAITSLSSDDLLDISQDTGGGTYATKKITYENMLNNIKTRGIVEVTQASDLPSTLVTDTTYVIRGEITTSTAINVTNEGSAIIGYNRNMDKLTYTGTGDFLTITDVNFSIRNLCLSATDSSSNLINASNYDHTSYNNGRLKTLSISDSQIRDCYNVMDVNGFDLCDFSNTLIWYVKATTNGCRFQSVSKLQFTSCELVRWFDETTIPTPSGYATVPMIELQANGSQAGFGAVNFTSCVVHPQQTQDGINISATSTTGFGTIAGNTFVTVGLTTGQVTNFDVDVQNSYIIQANQSLVNANAKGTMILTGNTVYLDNTTTNPIVIKGSNTVGGGGFTSPISFPIETRVITSVADGSFTYNQKNTGNFFVNIAATVQQAGNGFITIRVRQNGTAISAPKGVTEIRTGISDVINFSIIGVAELGDVFDFEVESSGGADVLISELAINGYQF